MLEIWHALKEYYSFVAPYLAPLTNVWATIITKGWPFVAPCLNRLAESAHEYPPVVVVGLFLLFMLVALQIIFFVQNLMSSVMRWIRNGLLLGALVVVGSVVYKRGMDKTLGEMQTGFYQLQAVWLKFYEMHQKGMNPQKSTLQQLADWIIGTPP